MDTKICTSCKHRLPIDAFHKNRTRVDGLCSRCKQCDAASYQAHRVEILTKKKARYKPHPKPSILSHDGRKRCTRCKQTKEATSAFFNRSKSSADGFYNECRACRTQIRQLRRTQSKDRWQRIKHDPGNLRREGRIRIREEMVAAYGGRCTCCGEAREPFLTLDHIGGRDNHNHPWGLTRGGTSIYPQLKQMGWPKDRYRLLCMNCNWAKRGGRECPHELER